MNGPQTHAICKQRNINTNLRYLPDWQLCLKKKVWQYQVFQGCGTMRTQVSLAEI